MSRRPPQPALRIIELFSCAGGMSEGFRRAGLPVALAFDRDPDACASYAHNLGHAPVQMDIHALLHGCCISWWSPGDIDLLVADPPCTPWSRAGKRRGLDDERDCLQVTRDLIQTWRPRAYLVGNVPGLDDVPNLPIVQELLAPLRDDGYCIADFRRLNAADYGVPQRRIRPFWFGHREGPCLTWPASTHCNPARLRTGQLLRERAPWQTVADALRVLPDSEWGEPAALQLRSDRHPPSRADRPAQTITAKQRSNGGSVLQWPWDRPATTVLCEERLALPGKHTKSYHSDPNAIRLSERAGRDSHRPGASADVARPAAGSRSAWPCRRHWPRLSPGPFATGSNAKPRKALSMEQEQHTPGQCSDLQGRPADAVGRCGCDESVALRVELESLDRLTDALDRIAMLCGYPNWTHADQVVRHIYMITGERDLLRADLQRHEQRQQRSMRALSAQTLTDFLVRAAPELSDIANLQASLAALDSHERLDAEHWARTKIAARGDLERTPIAPPCILGLYQRLTASTPEAPCS